MRAAERADRLRLAADLRLAAGQVDVDGAELAVHLVGGDAVGEHARGIEFDADFAIDAAEALHRADAGHGEQFALQIVVDEPGNILRRHAFAFDGVIADRLARGVDARDRRVR